MKKPNKFKIIILMTLALMLSVPAMAVDWPTRQYDARRAGVTTEQIVASPGSLWTYTDPQGTHPAWTQDPAQQDLYNSWVNLGPRQNFDNCMNVAVVGDYVYFGSSGSSTVKCLAAATGNVVWTFFTEGPVRFAPHVVGGNVYFGSDDGYVYCVNASTGSEVWKFRPGDDGTKVWGNQNLISLWPIRTGVVVADGFVYYTAGIWPSEGMYFGRVNASTGVGDYKVTSSRPHQGYLLQAGSYLYAPSGRTYPSSYATKNGKVKGDYDAHSTADGGSWGMITPDDSGYWFGPAYYTDPGNWHFKMDAGNPGSNYTLWAYSITYMADDGTNTYYVTQPGDDKVVKALSSTLASDWSKSYSYPYSIIVAGTDVFAGGDGQIASLNTSNGTRTWTANVTGKAYGLAAANGRLFASTDAGKIYCFGEGGSSDTDPPTPDPATWASAPSADSSVAISMTATTGSDATTPVWYLFNETTDGPGANDSGWQTSPNYTDTGLSGDTLYTYTVQMRDSVTPTPNVGAASSGASATTPVFTGADETASSDIPVSGTVSGSYTNTQASNNSYESITEVASGGKPTNRYSYLEHKWPISVTGGNPVTFYVEAYKTSNSEGDDFVFAYSTTGVDGSYTNMVTVTKTSDNDTAQSYVLPGGTSGTVHIRVLDTDQTGGNTTLDTIYIDHMHIYSAAGGPPETDPPTPDPATFASPPSADSDTAISMTATTGTDVTGPVQYNFTETTIGPGATNSGWQTSPDYTDSGLDPDTLYTYTVQMKDALGNTGTASSGASATTDAGCTPTDMHIEAVVCAETGGCAQGKKHGQATVTIYDDCGNPVENALVDGTFGGDYGETIYDISTDSNGQAVLTTAACAKRPTWTFTVDDVTGPLPYDSNDDLATGCSG